MSEKIILPDVPMELVRDVGALGEAVGHLRGSGRFAFDTEFIGEHTYQPVLCLVQVATVERVYLIDPMAIDREGMKGFWELLGDAGIEKICHAGDQDVEIAWQQSGIVAKNMFDTQIGAGMMGISYPTALWRVVEHFMGVTLDKAHTYSAWDRRPLSKSQFSYAVDDVRYLPAIHEMMKRRIGELGHLGWMSAACEEMCVESAGPGDARMRYVKIRGATGLDGEQLAVLREVTALREQIAFEKDLPARAVMKDEVLFDIASRMPTTEGELGGIRDLQRRDLADYGEEILGAIERGLMVPEGERPVIVVPGEDNAGVKRLGETLWVAAQVICLGQSVTPGLVTSQNEVMGLARLVHRKKGVEGHGLMKGWHGECLGEKLVAFIRGELKVEVGFEGEEMRAGFHSGGKSSE